MSLYEIEANGYDKLEETVRKSILSAHVRLGGITPQ
jgi:hypothetical protein